MKGEKMKIKPEHFEYLKSELTKVLDQYGQPLIDEYENGQFHNADKTKDLQKRFCADVLFGAGLSKWICDNLYSYLDDSHIYTATKSICPTLTRKY